MGRYVMEPSMGIPSRAQHPEVSLIIPVKNEGKRIAECLANLQHQTLKPAEIILVDGHSADETVSIAKRFAVRVIFEDFGTRGGACEVGIENAQGEYVAFTDADCLPEPKWLETLAKGFAPGIVGVGGRVVNEGDTFVQRSIDLALDTFLGSANSVQGRIYPTSRFVSSISGCNSMYRRADLLDVGGFDPTLVTTEDTELNWRLRKRGQLLFVPDAVVHHRHGRGLRDFARRMFQYGFGRSQSLLVGPMLAVPLGVLVFAALLYLQPLYVLYLLAAYGAVALLTAARVAYSHHNLRFLATVSTVFLTEHLAYVAGFWYGLFRSRIRWSRPPRTPQEEAQ